MSYLKLPSSAELNEVFDF